VNRSKTSAGLLMFRRKEAALEVLLVHPGGPFFLKKDSGAWTIPKGEATAGEDLRPRAGWSSRRSSVSNRRRRNGSS
jgi:Predicted NTP pyrophosphohydrolase